MTRCKQMFSVLALIAPIAALAITASPVVESEASATSAYANLCEVTNACAITLRDLAVPYEGDVCWNGVTTTAMGAGGCSNGGRPFSLNHGLLVDPITNTLVPMKPVAEACGAGYCDVAPAPWLDEGAICCNPDTAVCKEYAESCDGEILYCLNKEANGDGTVTCHEEG